MCKPGTSSQVEGDCILNLLGLLPQQPHRCCEDVIRCILDQVLDFDVKEELEIVLEAKLGKHLKHFQVHDAGQAMLPSPEEDDALGCGKPPCMAELSTQHLLKRWLPFFTTSINL